MEVHLVPDTPESITWKLTKNGAYSTATAYRMQFLGHDADVGLEALGSPQSARFLLGYFSEIVFGRQIDLREGVGQIAAYASFATNVKRRWRTFSSNVVSPREFGHL